MSANNTRKIGFFAAISICIGSMVGIGIFLKNASIGKNVGGNGLSWLLTWVISGLIALLVAIHFGKISRIELKGKTSGLSAWTDHIVSEKATWFKKLVSLNYGFFYLSILTLALGFFTVELLISFISQISPINLDVWVHFLISIIFISIFVLTNYLSIKFSGYISMITIVLKFIPLLSTIIIGIVFWNSHELVNNAGNVIGKNGFLKDVDFSFAIKGIMLSIPGVLFAFDSFVGIGALSKQVKNGEKAISKIIVFGMIFVAIIYLLVSVSSIFHYNDENGTTILNVLLDSLPKEASKSLTILITFALFISAYGTSNSIIGVCVKEFEHICHDQKMVGSSFLKKRFGDKKGGLFLLIITLAFWSAIIFIPSMILNTDAIIDGFSNLVVVYFFLIYSLIIFSFWKNIYKKDETFRKDSNPKCYAFLVFAAILGVILGIGLNIFFVIFDAISSWNNKCAWGLLLSGSTNYSSLTNLDVLIIYLMISPLFFTIPQLNFWLIKKIDKITIY